MIDPAWRDAQRVLLVRLDNLGDVLVTTPAIRAVRRAMPSAQLSLLCSPVGSQAARLNPDIDGVLEYEATWMDPWRRLNQDVAREHQMIEVIASEHFDAAIIFTSFRQSPLPAAYLCYLAGIPLRLGASVDGSGSLLTTRHMHEADSTQKFPHEVRRSMELVGAVGIEPYNGRLVLTVPGEARKRAREIVTEHLHGNGPVVVLHPGCSMPARTYPAEHFREVVRLLVHEQGATVFVTGTEAERELAVEVTAEADGAIALAGDLTFAEFCGLVEEVKAVICSNTGPMHVAAALGTPVVTLFALTNPPNQWAPWAVPFRQLYVDVSCRICYKRICPFHQQCLTGIGPQYVVGSTMELLAEISGSTTQSRSASLATGTYMSGAS